MKQRLEIEINNTTDNNKQPVSIYSFFMESESTARPMVLSPLSTYLGNAAKQNSATPGESERRRLGNTHPPAEGDHADTAFTTAAPRCHPVLHASPADGQMMQNRSNRLAKSMCTVLRLCWRPYEKRYLGVEEPKVFDTTVCKSIFRAESVTKQAQNRSSARSTQTAAAYQALQGQRQKERIVSSITTSLVIACTRHLGEWYHASSPHMVVPVMTRDRSDVRNSAALPTSSL